MPDFLIDGTRLHYTEVGDGPETVVFSHSYLLDHHHFDAQIAALAGRFRVLAYDHRGHGQSDRPRGTCSMEHIYSDGVRVAELLGRGPVHWVGRSTGGYVGLRFAIRRPELLRSLVLMDTAAGPEPAPLPGR